MSRMKLVHLSLVGLACFCTIDFVFIQSHFFIPCGWSSVSYGDIHPVYCNDVVQLLQSVFGMAASIGIASIVGICAFLSPKKSIILVGATAGLLVMFVIASQLLSLSMSVAPQGIMRSMTGTEVITMMVLRSPLWLFVLAAEIVSAIVWPIVVLRKKISGLR